jgi:hypothetical protein
VSCLSWHSRLSGRTSNSAKKLHWLLLSLLLQVTCQVTRLVLVVGHCSCITAQASGPAAADKSPVDIQTHLHTTTCQTLLHGGLHMCIRAQNTAFQYT